MGCEMDSSSEMQVSYGGAVPPVKWVKPFAVEKTVVFVSSKGERDTFFFRPFRRTFRKVKSFELGSYDEVTVAVDYRLSWGSYHKRFESPADSAYHPLFNMLDFGPAFRTHELSFLGLLFDEDVVDSVRDSVGCVYFDARRAKFSGLWMLIDIKGFTFCFDDGVVGFVDERGVEWVVERNAL